MYAGFPSGMFPKVCCPKDQGPLVYEGHKKFIREGEVRCVSCGYAYPIREGILNLVSAQPAFDEIAAANMAARDQEAPIYDSTGHTPSRIACELKAMLRELDPIEGKEILDVGCGTGSFALELLPRAGSVMGMDFSTQSLAVFAAGADYLADSAAIGVSLLAIWIASHPRGYPKATTVAALVNASLTMQLNDISLPTASYLSTLATSRLNYNFNTKVFLNALLQYNTDSHQLSSNIRFNIIHRPLSDFFFVYNEHRDECTGMLQDRSLIVKMTYMVAF